MRSAASAAPAPSPLVRAAALAAAAALGVMIGFGLRGVGADGWRTALARLAVVALRLRGVPEFVTPDRDAGAGPVFGGLQVAGIAAAWGAIVGAVRRRLVARAARPGLRAAVLVGVLVALASLDTLLPIPLRLAAGTLTGAEWAMMVALVAAAASIGARESEARP
ncbi:MAG TPA: hypothetical protein VGD56_21685 [Gemmatirosa sp.]